MSKIYGCYQQKTKRLNLNASHDDQLKNPVFRHFTFDKIKPEL